LRKRPAGWLICSASQSAEAALQQHLEGAAVGPRHHNRLLARIRARVVDASEPNFEEGWSLDDLRVRSPLAKQGESTRTTEPLLGRLVHITTGDGIPLSNRVVVDDPVALDAALHVRTRSSEDRPPELLSGDLDTPVGKALVWLHRNLIMDVTESTSGAAGSGGVGSNESDAVADDDLWERLEREKLGRDPRVNTYGRILGRPIGPGTTEPILELLEAMRDRAPALDHGAATDRPVSVLALLREQADHDREEEGEGAGDGGDAPKQHWKSETRVRVRARNVLRRWAAAQNDPRLVWIDQLAPAGNFAMVATTFARLWAAIGENPDRCELRAADLDQVWFEWMRPFVGTGRGDGWLDQIDMSNHAVRSRLPHELPETVAALSWLAMRRRSRDTTIAWQPMLGAALERGLVEPTDETARFVSFVMHSSVSRGVIEDDLLRCIEFIDDGLWCERTRDELGLDALALTTGSAGQAVSVRLTVKGIGQPLTDPRLPQLIVATRRYRRHDGVAVFSEDIGWRVVVETGQPAAYLPGGRDQSMVESITIADGLIEGLAASGGILADVFARDQVA
jgi:hypothetical protein